MDPTYPIPWRHPLHGNPIAARDLHCPLCLFLPCPLCSCCSPPPPQIPGARPKIRGFLIVIHMLVALAPQPLCALNSQSLFASACVLLGSLLSAKPAPPAPDPRTRPFAYIKYTRPGFSCTAVCERHLTVNPPVHLIRPRHIFMNHSTLISVYFTAWNTPSWWMSYLPPMKG